MLARMITLKTVSALVVLCGLAVLVYAAFLWSELAGLVALGVSLIAIGADVPRGRP